MKTISLASIILAVSSIAALAAADGNLSSKIMADHPGLKGGTTAAPLARQTVGDLSEQALSYQFGGSIYRGTTQNPTANPSDSSLASQEARVLGSR